MTQFISKSEHRSSDPQPITLLVKDTDFLLKLIMRSTFNGAEVEQAHTVLTKLAEIHRLNLEG